MFDEELVKHILRLKMFDKCPGECFAGRDTFKK